MNFVTKTHKPFFKVKTLDNSVKVKIEKVNTVKMKFVICLN